MRFVVGGVPELCIFTGSRSKLAGFFGRLVSSYLLTFNAGLMISSGDICCLVCEVELLLLGPIRLPPVRAVASIKRQSSSYIQLRDQNSSQIVGVNRGYEESVEYQ